MKCEIISCTASTHGNLNRAAVKCFNAFIHLRMSIYKKKLKAIFWGKMEPGRGLQVTTAWDDLQGEYRRESLCLFFALACSSQHIT